MESRYVVFSQLDGPPPAVRLVAQARAHFPEISLETVDPGAGKFRVRWGEREAAVHVVQRPTEAADVERARSAEVRGGAGGMSDLAARCRSLWIVTPEMDTPESLTLLFLSLLASVALGPVLPPDGDTLLGVRSARQRAANLLRGGS